MTNFSKISWLLSAVILFFGFLFLHFQLVNYGFTFFMIFPFAVGFSVGTLDRKKWGLVTLITGAIVFFLLLLAGALEGLVCVLMALPIFIIMLLIGHWLQKKIIKEEPDKNKKLMISLAPIVLLLLINPIEQMILPKPKVITIENAIELPYPPDIVFDEVKQMGKLDAEKPWGLKLGLPSPYKCVLEADTVGAKRYCHFDNGQIIAQITKYEKGSVLQMDVIDYTLTGRDWFQFVDASYHFEVIDNETTRITRTSSYRSVLNPRFYWGPLEAWGIEQEHRFVLASLKKNIFEKYGK